MEDTVMAVLGPTAEEAKILQVLSTDGGYRTGDVADLVWPQFGQDRRQASTAVRACLLGLQKKGLVRPMDDEKPVCWAKVAPVKGATGLRQPCPRCGGQPEVKKGKTYWVAACPKDHFPRGISATPMTTKAKALEAWDFDMQPR